MAQTSTISVVIGERLHQWRQDNQLRQEDVAFYARESGLLEWTRATVAAIETGRREVTTAELLALPSIVEAVLIAGNNDHYARVEYFLGPSFERLLQRPSCTERSLRRMLIVEAALPPDRPGVTSDPVRLEAHGEAEIKAARSLQTSEYTIAGIARQLWGKSLTDERDARAMELAGPDAPARSLQAHRGHVTRQLVAQLKEKLDQFYRNLDTHAVALWGHSRQDEIDVLVSAGSDPGEAGREVARQINAAIEEGQRKKPAPRKRKKAKRKTTKKAR